MVLKIKVIIDFISLRKCIQLSLFCVKIDYKIMIQ